MCVWPYAARRTSLRVPSCPMTRDAICTAPNEWKTDVATEFIYIIKMLGCTAGPNPEGSSLKYCVCMG